jgi:hypothetical protein
MGLLDKVKEQAAVASAAAKEAAQKGQAKVGDIQAKRAADALLRDLGVTVYAQHTGRADSYTAANADRLTAALADHEATHGPLALNLESTVGASGGAPTSDPSEAPPAPAGQPAQPPPSGQTL